MSISKTEKATIKKLLNLDIDNVLDELSSYLDEDTKKWANKTAIWYVTQIRPIDYDTLECSLKSGKPNYLGGIHGKEYFRLLRESVEGTINNEKSLLTEAICINFNYCKKRKDAVFQNEDYSLALALADSMLIYLTNFPLPIASVSVYLIKKGLLDQWCGCGAI